MILASFITTAFASLALGAPPQDLQKRIVSGLAFDRYVAIWLENTNFASAAADPNFKALTAKGIQLTNYFGVTHPSEPNYVSTVGGEYFGMQNDNLNNVPANVSTVVDLLEDKGISWAEYEEDMPSAGYTGMQFLNSKGQNDYVRKHNPLIIYDSVATVPARAAKTKNFVMFQQDLANNALPQWFFMTPNMTNDGHDSSISVASKWANNFLTPLLANPNFNAPNTLIVLSFDENGGATQNKVDTILLGSAVPASLIGTVDANFYNHYSDIATIEANWGLHTLGRYDVGSNVFSFVAAKTGDVVRTLPNLAQTTLSSSYPGIFNTAHKGPLPPPNTTLVVHGRTVLPAIVTTWGSAALQKCTVYNGSLAIPSGSNPPIIPPGC